MSAEVSNISEQPPEADTFGSTEIVPATRKRDLPISVIEPRSGWMPLDFAEVWRYRDLLMLLVRRDIAARYRQSLIGFGWVILKPLLTMVIFTVIFGRVAGLDEQTPASQSGAAAAESVDVPYSLRCFAALLPWMYFAGCVSGSSSSLVSSSALLKKVYFPRVILPLTPVLTGMIDFAIQFAVLLALMLWSGVSLGWVSLLAPVFVLCAALAALSVGLWLTALNVKYRDIGQAVPFFVQTWMWLCPIVYPVSKIPESYRWLYGLNPMVGVIEGFRWAVLGSAPPDLVMMTISLSVALTLLVGGFYYFRRVEMTFADII